MTGLDGFLESTVRAATPLAFAAAGELIAERSGVINLGLEGSIVSGAFAAFVVSAVAGPDVGLVAGGAAGGALALVFALFVLALRAQQIIAGTAITMLGIGVCATLHRGMTAVGPTATDHVETLAPTAVPLLSQLPVIGGALFNQAYPTYLLYAVFPLIAWVLNRSTVGLALRATGELPRSVRAAGYRPETLQLAAIVACGALAGLGGATLVVVDTGTFSDGISAGRGFVAIAIVALGRWTPRGVAAGAALFGGASAMQFVAQALGWNVPYNLVLATPYLLTIIAMAAMRGSAAAPAFLGRPVSESS